MTLSEILLLVIVLLLAAQAFGLSALAGGPLGTLLVIVLVVVLVVVLVRRIPRGT